VRLDDGKLVRQPVALSELPSGSQRLLSALVTARLMSTRGANDHQQSGTAGADTLIEVTHEVLFKAWPTLDRWLIEEQAFLSDLERIKALSQQETNAYHNPGLAIEQLMRTAIGEGLVCNP
jgi:hypothetical protein